MHILRFNVLAYEIEIVNVGRLELPNFTPRIPWNKLKILLSCVYPFRHTFIKGSFLSECSLTTKPWVSHFVRFPDIVTSAYYIAIIS